jgi:1-acyl-sn-glycerol-3-phosphate acyltransferase
VLKTWFAWLAGEVIVMFARLLTAVRGVWLGSGPTRRQRIYFANHTSNGDFVLVWAVLPPALRYRTRPVAAADYWLTSPLRAFAGRDVFRAVLIDRNPETRDDDPVAQMVSALDEGSSLIIFPEGRRNMGDDPALPFKTGLFHVASRRPEVDLVPAWIENMNHVIPKGEIMPVPLLCSVRFGAAIHLEDGEEKSAFLDRARAALVALSEEGVP